MRRWPAVLRRWPAVVLLALAPLWLIGTLGRNAWTPDEPREADIAWRMSQQSDRTLPQLAGQPFLEKPPLSYWLSAASLHVFGDSPAAGRMPNLLYAAVSALAIGSLAYVMSGPLAAVVAALAACSAITAFRVAVWLAPDACLLAGCALALLGAYSGFTAPAGRRKLLGYGLMHLGAAVGFMAKSAPGALVPALALCTIIVWERRWRELLRWELYTGLLIQAVLIGSWVYAVSRTPHGTDALVTLFWHNVVGRFTRIAGPVSLDYTTGHHNFPGKYWIELPVYLLPWTLLALAAGRRAWRTVRLPGASGTPWRFAIAASIPFLVLLSVAATARDIYAAPALIGFGLLIGLWASELAAGRCPDTTQRCNRLAVGGTHLLVVLIAVVLAGAAILLAIAPLVAGGDPDHIVALVAAAVTIIGFAIYASRFLYAPPATGSDAASGAYMLIRALAANYAIYVVSFVLFGLAAFPSIDRWQDLPRVAREIGRDASGHALAVWAPDETTIAMLDHSARIPFSILAPADGSAEAVIDDWFRTHGDGAQVLVRLPGTGRGNLMRVLEDLRGRAQAGDGIAATFVHAHVARITHYYELPQGRRYALLARAPA
ncbi:MAG TPA: glycosyltransferase family 39 protein [Steroidobacteraceae bacterium]